MNKNGRYIDFSNDNNDTIIATKQIEIGQDDKKQTYIYYLKRYAIDPLTDSAQFRLNYPRMIINKTSTITSSSDSSSDNNNRTYASPGDTITYTIKIVNDTKKITSEENVKTLQKMLNFVSKCDLMVDGKYGKNTQNCINKYQKSVNEDQKIDSTTCKKMNKDYDSVYKNNRTSNAYHGGYQVYICLTKGSKKALYGVYADENNAFKYQSIIDNPVGSSNYYQIKTFLKDISLDNYVLLRPAKAL